MHLDVEDRAARFLAHAHPTLLEARRDALDEGWRRVREHSSHAELHAFIDALPQGEWQISVVDDAPTFTNPTLDALPTRALHALHALRPWRKGPWNFAGTRIDAEWRSEQKWQRIQPLLPPLSGAHVVDVGSNNGYYAHRLLDAGARSVLGLEPQALYINQALCAEALHPSRHAYTLPLGLESLEVIRREVSLLLLMGILYHHSDPLSVLRLCAEALAPKGHVLIETIVIAGEENTALFVPRRYTGAKGFYWLPTLSCLHAWLQRAGLRVIEALPPAHTRSDEQRSTNWRHGDSLAEGLDPDDPQRTIEGHPAPQRCALLCTRG